MGDHHNRDLLRRIAGGADTFDETPQAGFATALTPAGIEEHDIRSGIDENRRETVDQRFGRQKVLLQQFRNRLLWLVGAIDLMRFLGDARAVIDDDELETPSLRDRIGGWLAFMSVFSAFSSATATPVINDGAASTPAFPPPSRSGASSTSHSWSIPLRCPVGSRCPMDNWARTSVLTAKASQDHRLLIRNHRFRPDKSHHRH
jgi:hypothetical protein